MIMQTNIMYICRQYNVSWRR